MIIDTIKSIIENSMCGGIYEKHLRKQFLAKLDPSLHLNGRVSNSMILWYLDPDMIFEFELLEIVKLIAPNVSQFDMFSEFRSLYHKLKGGLKYCYLKDIDSTMVESIRSRFILDRLYFVDTTILVEHGTFKETGIICYGRTITPATITIYRYFFENYDDMMLFKTGFG